MFVRLFCNASRAALTVQMFVAMLLNLVIDCSFRFRVGFYISDCYDVLFLMFWTGYFGITFSVYVYAFLVFRTVRLYVFLCLSL